MLHPDHLATRGRVALATNRLREGEAIEGGLELDEDEGLIVRLAP